MEEKDRHYSREELWGAYLGDLSRDCRAAIRQHFEDGCSLCLHTAFEMLNELLGEVPEPIEEAVPEVMLAAGESGEPDAYDLAIEHALERARKVVGRVRKERSKLPEALEFLSVKGGQAFGREAPVRLRGLAGVEALLQKSWDMRYEDPHEMVFLANLASIWAQRLDPNLYGSGLVGNLQCRSLIELGNAYRVADDLDAAHRTFDDAARLLAQGAGDELLEARLCDVQASLHGARRSFASSCEALDTVYKIHMQRGDRHLAGRALISKGVYAGYGGDTLEAEKFIGQGLALLDEGRDSDLVLTAIQNLAYLLIERDEFRKARSLLFMYRSRFGALGGKINQLKLRWLDGKISAGLGNLAHAEAIFREIWQGFQGERLGYKAALSALELALVLQQMGRKAEARDVILEACDVFLLLKVHREAMASMLVLRKACESDVATPALLRSTIYFLTRVENNPKLAAEDFLSL